MSFYGINKSRILKAVNVALPKNKAIHEFGLVFVSAKKMAELNKKYRGQAKPTNVLSFPALERNRLGRMKFISFKSGDVVICPEVVSHEAKKYGFTQKNWMTRLVVHGILHLTGYDHVHKKDELEMESLEKSVLKKLGI